MGPDLPEPPSIDELHFRDPTLLRAARVADLLHRGGRIFASSGGTTDTYTMSVQATHIDVFVSHNWAVGRMRKFVLLAVLFNLEMAVNAAAAAILFGVSVTYVVARGGYLAVLAYFPLTCACTMAAFSFTLLFGHEVKALLGFRGESCFLDKLCIHQTDPLLKELGIRNLGAFLHHSSSLVVCFTELYFKRLWTVYEFASFLLVHGEGCPGAVRVVPTTLPVLLLAGSFFLFAGVICDHFGLALGMQTGVLRALALLSAVFMLICLTRRWARQQHEARVIFKEFALADTRCDSDGDRELVVANIVSLMRHFSPVGVRATEADALLAFDEFVRTAGSRAFAESIGTLGCPYKMLAFVQLPIFSEALHWWSIGASLELAGHRTAVQAALMLVGHLSQAFTVVPLAGALGLYLTKYCIRLRGFREVAFCAAVALVVFAAIAILAPTVGLLRPYLLNAALQPGGSPVPFLLYSVALFTVTAVVFRQAQHQAAGAAAAEEEAPPVDGGPPLDAGVAALAAGVGLGAWEVAEKGDAVVELDEWEPI